MLKSAPKHSPERSVIEYWILLMKHKHLFGTVVGTCLPLVMSMTPVVAGDVNATEFWNDKDAWDATVPVYETLDFTGFTDAEWLSDQYADQGVTFS
ncbi:MAG: hypothetical protein EA377_10045, partial [Phycisphaerales bacterium]